jgi:AcrR family transcriptional regulator
MTLDEICERLSLPKGTVYYWIKDIPIPRTDKQTERQKIGTRKMQEKFKAIREAAYQQGWEEAPELNKDIRFHDFVVLYTAEGTRRNYQVVGFCNSNPRMMQLAYFWMQKFTENKIRFQLQCHADHDEQELKAYWGRVLDIPPDIIRTIRKSNSGQLSGRNFRSVYGVLSIDVSDVKFRARLQAWMDFVQNQW